MSSLHRRLSAGRPWIHLPFLARKSYSRHLPKLPGCNPVGCHLAYKDTLSHPLYPRDTLKSAPFSISLITYRYFLATRSLTYPSSDKQGSQFRITPQILEVFHIVRVSSQSHPVHNFDGCPPAVYTPFFFCSSLLIRFNSNFPIPNH